MAQQAEQFAPVVTDRGGHLVLLLREDGAGPYLIDLVRRRGYTATSANSRTSAISKVEDERSGAPEPHLVLSRGLLMAGGPRADLGYALSALDDDFDVYIITDACGDVSSEGMLQIGRRSSICCEPQRDWARTDTAGTTTSAVLSHAVFTASASAYAARMSNAADGR